MSNMDNLIQRLRRAIDHALTFSDDVVDDRAMPFDDLAMRDRALSAFDAELRLHAPAEPLQPEGEQEFSLLSVLKAAANYIILPEQMEQLSPGAREAIIKGLLWAIHEVEDATTAPPTTPSAAAMRAAEEIVHRNLVYFTDLDGPRKSRGAPETTAKVAAIITRHLAATTAPDETAERSGAGFLVLNIPTRLLTCKELPSGKDVIKAINSMYGERPPVATLSDKILETLDDAVMRVGASANCYDSPADATNGARYVATRMRQLIHSWDRPMTGKQAAKADDFQRFYFLDSHGEEPFMRVSDHERIRQRYHDALLTRDQKIRKVLGGLRSSHRKVDICWCSHDASDGLHDNTCLAALKLWKELNSDSTAATPAPETAVGGLGNRNGLIGYTNGPERKSESKGMPLTRYYIEDMKRLDKSMPTNKRCCNYHASGGVVPGCNTIPLTADELDGVAAPVHAAGDDEGELAEARKRATQYFRWAYQLLLALAKRRLADANAENEAKGEPNNWPAGQEWHEMVGSSHSIFLRGACAEAKIPEDAFMGVIRSSEIDVDDLYAAALRSGGES